MIWILFFACINVTVATAAGPPIGFREFKWGAHPSSKIKKIGSSSDGTAIYFPSSDKKLAPLFGLPIVEEAYQFSNGKFFSGSAWLDGKDNFEKIKAAMTKEFGTPSFANEGIYLWKWKWPGSQIEVHLNYQEKYFRTTITFVNKGI